MSNVFELFLFALISCSNYFGALILKCEVLNKCFETIITLDSRSDLPFWSHFCPQIKAVVTDPMLVTFYDLKLTAKMNNTYAFEMLHF